MSKLLTTVQEVFFDLQDLINSGQIDDVAIDGFQEFETLLEFVQEQRDKLAQIEELIKQESEA
jgi:hypothetical protein